MRRRFPLLALLLLLSLLPLSLLSCRRATAEEVLPAARALIERSLLINDIFIGEGAPRGDGGFEGYDTVSEEWTEQTGITSVAALRAEAEAVYTAEVCDILYRKALKNDHETLADYRDRPSPGHGLLVLSEREGWYRDVVLEYLYDTMQLTDSAADTATVTLTVLVGHEGEERQERTLTLPLVRQEDGTWRCDKLTYVAPLPLID